MNRTPQPPVTGYIEGTQRGFAIGLRRGDVSILEQYVHAGPSEQDIRIGYEFACNAMARLESTWKVRRFVVDVQCWTNGAVLRRPIGGVS